MTTLGVRTDGVNLPRLGVAPRLVGWREERSVPDPLSLAVELVNTLDQLVTPPDRLTDLEVARHLVRTRGWPGLAGSLPDTALPEVVALRERLRAVFATADLAAVTDLLNALLDGAQARLVPAGGEEPAVELRATSAAGGVTGITVLLADALARHVARYGVVRLGVCEGAPCACVFVDRTKAVRQRYCSSLCSDRVAAAAYRRRRAGAAAPRSEHAAAGRDARAAGPSARTIGS
jgi:predicted RNA-binding Zn ribbon-like protein